MHAIPQKGRRRGLSSRRKCCSRQLKNDHGNAAVLAAQRIAVLVDSENLEITVAQSYEPPRGKKSTHRAYPDWLEILPQVIGGREVFRSIYYKKRGLKISGNFRRIWCEELKGEIRQPEKSVDPYIIVDAISLSEKADVIVLLAGDKDYLPLIWFLRSKGCKVEMASFEEAAANVLMRAADRFYLLGESHTVVLPRSSGSESV